MRRSAKNSCRSRSVDLSFLPIVRSVQLAVDLPCGSCTCVPLDLRFVRLTLLLCRFGLLVELVTLLSLPVFSCSCCGWLLCEGERKGAPDEKAPGILTLKTLATVLNMAHAAHLPQHQHQQHQQQQLQLQQHQHQQLGLAFGVQPDPEAAAKKAALELLKSVGMVPGSSYTPMCIDQTGPSPAPSASFPQVAHPFGQVPGASWSLGGQTPPGQALGSAVLLAAQAQGPASLSFALTPEPFLPASLPSAITAKLEKGEYIEFEEAFKSITGSDTPISDSSEAKSEESKKSRITLLRDWLIVFAAMTVWMADYQPARLRDYVAYLKAFVMLTARSGFKDAYEYDRANRRYCSRAGALLAIYKGFLWLPPSAASSSASTTAPNPNRKRARDSTSDTRGPKKQRRQRVHDGVEVCFKFNKGSCADKCPNGRAHVCWSCSKEHPQTACKGASSSSAIASKGGKS